jgi:hypothetical protein
VPQQVAFVVGKFVHSAFACADRGWAKNSPALGRVKSDDGGFHAERCGNRTPL